MTYEEHFCDNILNLEKWLRRRRHLKDISSFSSGGHFVWRGKAVCAILVEGIMGNSYVKLFLICTGGLGKDVF